MRRTHRHRREGFADAAASYRANVWYSVRAVKQGVKRSWARHIPAWLILISELQLSRPIPCTSKRTSCPAGAWETTRSSLLANGSVVCWRRVCPIWMDWVFYWEQRRTGNITTNFAIIFRSDCCCPSFSHCSPDGGGNHSSSIWDCFISISFWIITALARIGRSTISGLSHTGTS